jgi:iron(III) transport system substrate-binding protein
MMTRLAMTLAAASILAIGAAIPALADEVNIYTTREPGLIQPILDAFTAETGIAVNTVFLENGLIERVSAEGESSPADLLMTVDFGALIDLVNAGLTQPVQSDVLAAAVPEALRDPEGNWFALSGRARVVYAAKDLDLDSITYEQLADAQWANKLCIRSGQHPYNTAMIAAYIAKHGEEATKAWLEGQPGPRRHGRGPRRRPRHSGRHLRHRRCQFLLLRPDGERRRR